MTSEFSDLAQRFSFNRKTIDVIVDVFGDEDWQRPASPGGGNTAHWILGHLTSIRRALSRKLGADLPAEEWEPLFLRASQPGATDAYPSPAVLLQSLATSDELMTERLARLTDEGASASWGSKLPDGSATLGAASHFLYFHECYHMGQLGLLRRIAGHQGFI